MTMSTMLVSSSAVASNEASPQTSMQVYIGTYTGPKSRGIYLAPFNPATGKLGKLSLAASTPSPSFLALHPKLPVLYAVGETSKLGPDKEGAVSAFRIDAPSGQLTFLNREPSGGRGPCHLSVDRAGRWVLVANYGSGSIAVLPIESGGRLSAPCTVVQHHGSSANPKRQAGPHAHFITTDPSDAFALACDLGLDKVLVYRFDKSAGALTPNVPPAAALEAGSGPRHLAFSPDGRQVYVVSEMGSTVTAFDYDPKRGALHPFQTISTLPRDFGGDNIAAEVAVHPSGKFLYASNRGHNTIAVFRIDPATGMLTAVEYQSSWGKTPRHFAIDPTGRWLLAADKDSDRIVVFRINQRSGRLRPTGQVVDVGAPVCVLFSRPKP
jgi:6-phosphogluconolactonase